MNTGLPSYFTQGYLRGKFGNCPKCTVHTRKGAWIRVQKLRAEYLLVPTKKWGVPVYPLQGKNLLRIYARKDSTVLGFFKGALLFDPHRVLLVQGNIRLAGL